MSDSTDDKSDPESGRREKKSLKSKKLIRRNLNSFLNPSFGNNQAEPDPNGAAHMRMAQMELANKMRLNQGKDPKAKPKAVPMHRSPPPGGFGAAHGVFQLKQKGNFGNKPSSSKPSPYQQILANASSKDPGSIEPPLSGGEIEEVLAADQPVRESHELEVIDIPYDAEVTQGEKRTKGGKRFRNPRL